MMTDKNRGLFYPTAYIKSNAGNKEYVKYLSTYHKNIPSYIF